MKVRELTLEQLIEIINCRGNKSVDHLDDWGIYFSDLGDGRIILDGVLYLDAEVNIKDVDIAE